MGSPAVARGLGDESFAALALNNVRDELAQFKPTRVGGGGGGAEAAYVPKAQHSGKCLDVDGWSTANGAPIQTWACHYGDNQRFRIYDAGEGYIQIRPKHSNRCLDVAGWSRIRVRQSSNGTVMGWQSTY